MIFFFNFTFLSVFLFLKKKKINTQKNREGESPKENPYEDVELKGRHAGRKSHQLPENSLDSLHRMWTPQDRKYTSPPQVMHGFAARESRFFLRSELP